MLVRGICPRCGAKVEPDSGVRLAETLLFKDAPEDRSDAAAGRQAESASDPLIGTQLHVYRCESLLGQGGMGRVYLAFHCDLHRKCALKVLSPRTAEHEAEYLARFELEGRAAAALIHPNIVTVHAIGERSGHHFLEMEFVAGRSLQELIHDESRFTPIRATVLAARIAEGLSAAHRKGIVHCDLKPDNVLMTHRSVPKIGDFGLAKRILSGQDSAHGRLVGTPNFMAPELFQGQPATPASDVYALGVCYFLMLSGRLPFVGGSLSALRRSVTSDPLPNIRDFSAEVSLEMAECLSLLTAKSPANRPADGIEAAQLMHAVTGHFRDIESLLTEAFQDARETISWTRRGSRYRILLDLPDGRRQTVFVEPSDDTTADQLLLMYSVCCDANPEYFEQALRLNSEVPHGSLALRDIDGATKFVMVDTYPRATVDVEEVRRSLLEVAFRADAVEKLLTGFDQN